MPDRSIFDSIDLTSLRIYMEPPDLRRGDSIIIEAIIIAGEILEVRPGAVLRAGDPIAARGRTADGRTFMIHLGVESIVEIPHDCSALFVSRALEHMRRRVDAMRPTRDPLGGLPPEVTPALLEMAEAGRKDDFLFLAGSAGVPAEKREELWTGTRRRLGLD